MEIGNILPAGVGTEYSKEKRGYRRYDVILDVKANDSVLS